VGNTLSLPKRIEVIAHLVEGAGIRPTSRLTGVSKPAILALLTRIGLGCDRLHDRLVRDLDIRAIQMDEIWSYVQKKQSRVTAAESPEHGDAYTFVALAKASKLVIAYRVGKRDQASTEAFVTDLRARLLVVPQLSTDGFQPYPLAIGQSFGGAVDYAVIHKDYSRRRQRDDEVRYEPPRDPFITKRPVFGVPDMRAASTSHVERANLTMRMHIRRFTRLCNGFSKKLDNHRAAVALHFAWYNFCRIHESLRVTPAMEAGLTNHVWGLEELATKVLDEPCGARPVAKVLRLSGDAGSARELPGGRGWLRVVDGGPSPAVAPVAPPPAPTPGPAVPVESALPAGQLDLFSWRPKPRKAEQLSLFPEG
jgi:IS1 family transposase